MTISSSTNRYQYSGSGSTGPFTITDLEIQDNTQLSVVKTSGGINTTLDLTTDYTVNAALTELTLVVALAVGETLTITLNIPATQATDYKNTSTLNAETLEEALDKLTLKAKQDEEQAERSVKFTLDTTTFPEVPDPSGNGNGYLRLNPAGTAFTYNNPAPGSGIGNVVDDTSPQLGGNLDPNGNHIATDTGLEILKFSETASAVNELTVTNAATGNGPELSATGDDTNIDLNLTPKGSGKLVLDGINWPNADGSANQVLTTNGSGVLSFVDAAGGATELLLTATASTSSTLDFESNINSTYSYYIFSFDHIVMSTSADLNCRLSINGGSSYPSGASDYRWAQTSLNDAGSETYSGDNSDSEITVFTGATNAITGNLYLWSPYNTAVTKRVSWEVMGGGLVQVTGWGNYGGSVSAVDALRFFPSTGNFTSGTIRMYGVKAS